MRQPALASISNREKEMRFVMMVPFDWGE